MTARKKDQGTHSKEGQTGAGWTALPQAARKPDKGAPGGGQGRVGVTGTMPKGVRVAPDNTEGHPGYLPGERRLRDHADRAAEQSQDR